MLKLSFVLMINIIKTKESLNSGGQQFHQYHQNKRNLNSDGQQLLTITV
jgi:hypothetical protein